MGLNDALNINSNARWSAFGNEAESTFPNHSREHFGRGRASFVSSPTASAAGSHCSKVARIDFNVSSRASISGDFAVSISGDFAVEKYAAALNIVSKSSKSAIADGQHKLGPCAGELVNRSSAPSHGREPEYQRWAVGVASVIARRRNSPKPTVKPARKTSSGFPESYASTTPSPRRRSSPMRPCLATATTYPLSMNRLCRVVLAVGFFASAALTGCSQAAPPVPGPSSSILPAVTFPAGSTLTDSKRSTSLTAPGNLETWDVPLSFDMARDRLKEQLPIGLSFAGAPYEGEDVGVDKFGNEMITWSWGDTGQLVSVIAAEYQPKREGHVAVAIGVFSD